MSVELPRVVEYTVVPLLSSVELLSKSVELPRVVEYTMVHLLKVQKLLRLAAEQTHR
jgi:hypothetical protein